MSNDTPNLNRVTELTAGFFGWLLMVTMTFILFQQWIDYGMFIDNITMFIVMFFITCLFVSVSWIATKWLWQSARTILLNRDIVRTCRSVWSEWLKEFRR